MVKSSRKRPHQDSHDTAATAAAPTVVNNESSDRAASHQILATTPDEPTTLVLSKRDKRHLRKRLKQGLSAVETPQERRQRKQAEALAQREEELERLGMVADEDNNNGNNKNNKAKEEINEEVEEIQPDGPSTGPTVSAELPPPAHTKSRQKPVPTDYICQACQNQHTPPHWIYDCPLKVHKSDPKLKLFVSGLPLDCSMAQLHELFAPATISSIKLFRFEDSRRCNGQALLYFKNSKALQQALLKNGSTIMGSNQKQLVLRVQRAKNRSEMTRQRNT